MSLVPEFHGNKKGLRHWALKFTTQTWQNMSFSEVFLLLFICVLFAFVCFFICKHLLVLYKVPQGSPWEYQHLRVSKRRASTKTRILSAWLSVVRWSCSQLMTPSARFRNLRMTLLFSLHLHILLHLYSPDFSIFSLYFHYRL